MTHKVPPGKFQWQARCHAGPCAAGDGDAPHCQDSIHIPGYKNARSRVDVCIDQVQLTMS